MDIHRVFIDSFVFNMSSMVYKNNYCAINIDKPILEGLYAMQFISMSYTIKYSIKVNYDTITEVT